MSKISPCLWFARPKPRKPPASMCSLVPDSSIDTVQRAPDRLSRAARPAHVLVVELHAGRPASFMALNGGMPCHIQHGRVLQHPLRRPGRGRSFVGRHFDKWRQGKRLRLDQRPLGRALADRAERLY